MPKLKIEEGESLSKYERQKMQRLYMQGAAAYGSVSYTKFTLETPTFKRIRAFASFRNDFWCMDLAYVDKLTNENNGVKFLLVRQDLFNRTENAKGMKTKIPEKL